MSSNRDFPDYDIVDRIVVTKPAELRAMADPLRTTILDLLLERAATVAELAAAVGRPKSTVAYHVNVLVGAGMLRVVRTRRVRAIEERFYGRTARVFFVGKVPLADVTPPPWTNYLADAAAESMPAYHAEAATVRPPRAGHPPLLMGVTIVSARVAGPDATAPSRRRARASQRMVARALLKEPDRVRRVGC